jgi:DNA-binding NarL/FixJ family response regulator
MDGKTCFTELRRINKDGKVVLASGYNEQEATSHFAGKGLAGFVQKPYLPQTLEKIMRQLIEGDA